MQSIFFSIDNIFASKKMIFNNFFKEYYFFCLKLANISNRRLNEASEFSFSLKELLKNDKTCTHIYWKNTSKKLLYNWKLTGKNIFLSLS